MTNTDPGAPEYEFDWQNPNLKTFDFGRVLGRAFSGMCTNVKPLIIGLIIVLTFTTIISILSTGRVLEVVGDGSIDTAITNPNYWMWSFIPGFLTLFFVLWIQLIIVETSYAGFTNTAQPASPLISSLKNLLPMFVVAIIYSILCILGFYALLIGFIFVWPGWALAGPILVHERKGVFGSLGRAWSLSKGAKRWIFLLLILLGLIGSIFYSIASGIAILGTGVNIFGGDPLAALNMSLGQQILFNIVGGIGGYAMYILFASGLTAAYVEVKTMKEGAPSVGEIFS